jgi:hypothetical protein
VLTWGHMPDCVSVRISVDKPDHRRQLHLTELTLGSRRVRTVPEYSHAHAPLQTIQGHLRMHPSYALASTLHVTG